MRYLLLFVLLFSSKFVIAQPANDVQLYTFAHSLIDHRPPLIPTPSDETTIVHWMYDIAQSSSKTFATTGQFGQVGGHVDNLPPNSDLGYDIVPNSWDENFSTFGNSDLNTIFLTLANFIQWVPPTDPDPSDPMGRSVVENTETLFDWTENEKPGMRYYIYGNWPEMDLQSAFPPTPPLQSEIDHFHDVTAGTIGGFEPWWRDLQDELMTSRPMLNTRLIPVGMIISKILRDVIPNQIQFDELYEDSAPHGRANVYFLAGMISYMAIYEENIPSSYMPGTIISPVIRNNLDTIRKFAFQQLLDYDFPNGDSRVFYNEPVLSVDFLDFSASQAEGKVHLQWSTASEQNNDKFLVQTSADGHNFTTIGEVKGSGNTSRVSQYEYMHDNISKIQNKLHYYRLVQVDFDGTSTISPIRTVIFKNKIEIKCYPNPTKSGVPITISSDYPLGGYKVFNSFGVLVNDGKQSNGALSANVDTGNLPSGMYMVLFESGRAIRFLVE